jgi:hypothetical protein
MELNAIQLTHKPFLFDEFKNDEQNVATTKEWMTQTPKKVFDLGFDTTLYHRLDTTGGEVHDWYFAVNGERTVYAVRVGTVKVLPINALCQVGVWAAKSGWAVPKRFAPTVFWDFLFVKANLISDSIQTEYGKAFWLNRIAEAFDKNLCVYWVRIEGSSIKEVYRMGENARGVELLNKVWGDAVKMQEIRLLITKHPLHFPSKIMEQL